MRRLALVAIGIVALSACGRSSQPATSALSTGSAAPSDAVAPPTVPAPPAPVAGAAAPAPKVNASAVAGSAPGEVQSAPIEAPAPAQAQAAPPELTVKVDRDCVERGQTLGITVSNARPATALGWAVAYSDGGPKESMGFGETDANGTWTTTVLVQPAAPLGEGRVVVGAAADDRSYSARGLAPFRVEEVGGCA